MSDAIPSNIDTIIKERPTFISISAFASYSKSGLKLGLDSQLFTFGETPNGSYTITEHYGFLNRTVESLYGKWSRETGLELVQPGAALYDRRNDLFGAEFTCVVKDAPPTMIIEKNLKTGIIQGLKGTFKNLSQLLLGLCEFEHP